MLNSKIKNMMFKLVKGLKSKILLRDCPENMTTDTRPALATARAGCPEKPTIKFSGQVSSRQTHFTKFTNFGLYKKL